MEAKRGAALVSVSRIMSLCSNASDNKVGGILLANGMFAIKQNGVCFILAVVAVLLLTVNSVKAASLTASVDRTELAMGDSLNLTLKLEGTSIAAEPDFSILDPFFTLGGVSRGSQTNIVNGKVSISQSWQLPLRPKREGRLMIPTFKLNSLSSQAIALEVSKARVYQDKEKLLRFEVSANKTTAVVGEQLIVTQKILFALDVSNLESEPLKIEGAKVTILEPKQYQTTIDGKDYGVYEMRALVAVLKPGALVIAAQQVHLGTGKRSVFGGSQNRVTLQSQALEITVTELPEQAKGLLVADKLTLAESWSSDAERFVLGQSLTRTLEVYVEGGQPANIAPLAMSDIDKVSIYPEPASKSEYQNERGVVLQRSRSFAIVPTQLGRFNIPAYTIRWWNALQGRIEQVQLPARLIEVIADPNTVSLPIIPQAKANQNITQNVETLFAENERGLNVWLLWALIASGIVILGLLVGLWQIYSKLNRLQQVLHRSEQADRGNLTLENRAFKALQKSIKTEKLVLIQQSLFDWSVACHNSQLLNKPGILGLMEVGEAKLVTQLSLLQRALYQNADPRAVIDCKALLESLEFQRKILLVQMGKKGALSGGDLATSLYPN